MELEQFKAELTAWLDANAAELTPPYSGVGTLDDHLDHLTTVKRMTYDAGFMRWGWPERVGGFGGSSLLRGYLGEQLTLRDFVEPGAYSMAEVMAPTMIDFARPELAAEMVPKLLRGDETWCQGFSEPSTGSNLSALTCRATPTDDGWSVSGQKVWTSFAHRAQRCILLTRTGDPESAHRGITAFFLDMDTPGITVRTIETMHGVLEFCEVFFDDVRIPRERLLGEPNQGWSVAMDLLPYERSTSLWHRAALLQNKLNHLLETAPAGAIDPMQLGEVVQHLAAFRARSRRTQHRFANGETLGAETSIDKVLLGTGEQAVFDLALDSVPELIVAGDDDDSAKWRTKYLYSRAATIYGGTYEVQRNIIARRLLDLGNDR